MPHDAASLLRRFAEEVWVARRLEVLAELVAEDYELENLADGGQPPVRIGREGLEADARGWFTAFPDLDVAVEDVFGIGDRAVLRMRVRGIQAAAFQGIAAPGAEIDVRVVGLFRARDGVLAGHASLLDAFGLLRQLGAVAPLAGPPAADEAQHS